MPHPILPYSLDMKHLAKQYLASRKGAWAKSTMESESSRLAALLPALDGNPLRLWTHLLATAKPYTRTVAWTRASCFWAWLIQEGHKSGPNLYDKWRDENAQAFKNCYERKKVPLNWDEAKEAIATIADPSLRHHAEFLLSTGLRWAESIQSNERVLGKGGRSRVVYGGGSGTLSQRDYGRFARSLRHCGLTPHSLRKLFATRLASSGAQEADLLAVMGWSSIVTAQSYLQPKKDEELRKLVQGL